MNWLRTPQKVWCGKNLWLAEGGNGRVDISTAELKLNPIGTWPNSSEHLHPQQLNFVDELNSVTVKL
jgi:hypothetical protein